MTGILDRPGDPAGTATDVPSTDTGPVRVEGRLKVTGAAQYAADHTPPGTLYAVLVGATIAHGTVTSTLR